MGGPLTDEDKRWRSLLESTTNFEGSSTRLNSVARVLALNEFDGLARLAYAPPPAKSRGAERLQQTEIRFLEDLIKNPRKEKDRSRSVAQLR